jgi:hypothetical protein
MDMLVNESNRARQQTHYRSLAVKYRDQAQRSPHKIVAAGYLSLANGYEFHAQRLGKMSHLLVRADQTG